MSRCKWCEAETTGYTGRCRTCKSKLHHAFKRIDAEKLIIDEAGGGWWVWSAKGDVLVIGQATRELAIRELALSAS